MSRRRQIAAVRNGLSLLEVMLAVAILFLAVAALGELVRLGLRSAQQAQLKTAAQLLCESKISEITSGLLPPEPISGAAFDPIVDGDEVASDWVYSIELAPVEEEGLVALTVTVSENKPAEAQPVQFTLVRWIQDPGIELPEETEEPASETTSGQSTGSTTTNE